MKKKHKALIKELREAIGHRPLIIDWIPGSDDRTEIKTSNPNQRITVYYRDDVVLFENEEDGQTGFVWDGPDWEQIAVRTCILPWLGD